MTNWKLVEKTKGAGGRRPNVDVVRILQGGRAGPFRLFISENLCTADRADVLTDGNGKLGVKFHSGGAVRASSGGGRARQKTIALRKAAGDLFPPDFKGRVPWTREGDLIVIDTRKLEG